MSSQAAYRCNDDIDLLALLLEESHFRFDEFLRHDLGVATSASTIFLDLHFDEFRSKRLNLFTSS